MITLFRKYHHLIQDCLLNLVNTFTGYMIYGIINGSILRIYTYLEISEKIEALRISLIVEYMIFSFMNKVSKYRTTYAHSMN